MCILYIYTYKLTSMCMCVYIYTYSYVYICIASVPIYIPMFDAQVLHILQAFLPHLLPGFQHCGRRGGCQIKNLQLGTAKSIKWIDQHEL